MFGVAQDIVQIDEVNVKALCNVGGENYDVFMIIRFRYIQLMVGGSDEAWRGRRSCFMGSMRCPLSSWMADFKKVAGTDWMQKANNGML